MPPALAGRTVRRVPPALGCAARRDADVGGRTRAASCSRPFRPKRSDTGRLTSASGEPAELAHLWRGDRGLGQQVGAQVVGEGRRVDRVVLDPPGSDRLRGERVRHVGLDPCVGEQVGEPAPAVRRLKGDRDRLGLELPEDPPECLPAVLEAAGHLHVELIDLDRVLSARTTCAAASRGFSDLRAGFVLRDETSCRRPSRAPLGSGRVAAEHDTGSPALASRAAQRSGRAAAVPDPP